MRKSASKVGVCMAAMTDWVGGELVGNPVYVSGATQDSRKVQAGNLFVALPGEYADGHDYVAGAAKAGAAAALVSRIVDVDIPQLVVADVEQALQQAATAWRQQLDVSVIAITGSCGKTTVKQMLAAILQQQAPTLATAGNLNNHLGVPLTLLGLTTQHRYAVIEMGASGAGDIELLCQIAQPNVGLVTMVAEAHLAGFGDLAGVAAAKGEIFAGLGANCVAVMNSDEAWMPLWSQLSNAGLNLSFGSTALADVSVSQQHTTAWLNDTAAGSRFVMNLPQGSVDVVLPLPGWHNVMNACAAAAAATAVNISADVIVAGLEQAENVAGRLQLQRLDNGCLLIDDSYNANRASILAAAQWLMATDISGQRVLVLGEMAELGDDVLSIHMQLGQQLAALDVAQLWVCGGEAAAVLAKGFGDNAFYFEQHDALISELSPLLDAADAVLVKGSRSASMETVVHGLATTVTGTSHKRSGEHHAG